LQKNTPRAASIFPVQSRAEARVKIVLNVLGVLLVMFGGVWFLQGLNLFPGQSFMNGQIRWSINGGIAFVLGVILLIWTNRRAKPAS
jgi:hypothetical protein